MEVFAGSANLSRALNELDGVHCVPIDKFTRHESHDVGEAYVRNLVTMGLLYKVLKYIHLAIPCETHSQARHPTLRMPMNLRS